MFIKLKNVSSISSLYSIELRVDFRHISVKIFKEMVKPALNIIYTG